MRSWFSSHKERVAYGFAAALLVVGIGATSAGAVLLRRSANDQRQTFRLHDLAHAAVTQRGVGTALARVAAHDHAAGARLRAAAPAQLERAVDVEIQRLAGRAYDRYPIARWVLVSAAVAFVLLVGVLIWLFELQRRAGRIDRDHARLREEFVAVVSHELRTPLTSILGYVEMIQDEAELEDEQRAYFDVIKRNANRLLYLVSDLLLVAESDDGLRLDVSELDVETLVRQSVEAAQVAADAKGIELVCSAQPARLEADPLRLAQVLDNLVSNAIKYTPDGGRVVVTSWVQDGQAWFEVTDSGVGIAPADRQQIFERFYRVRGKDAPGGAGLGLAITKAIVDAHGGTISLESELGAGASFRVSLPLQELEPVAPRVAGVEAPTPR